MLAIPTSNVAVTPKLAAEVSIVPLDPSPPCLPTSDPTSSLLFPSIPSSLLLEPSPQKVYQAVVIGAGPAGIAAVGALLEKNIHPIHWIDPTFTAGRIHEFYREVPSNTRTQLITSFATSVPAFRKIWSSVPSPSSLEILSAHDPQAECSLSLTADVCLELTENLLRLGRRSGDDSAIIEATKGQVRSAEMISGLDGSTERKVWRLDVAPTTSSSPILAHRIFFCTGSSPTIPQLPSTLLPKLLPLDLALQPSYLAACLRPAERGLKVVVVGASHSAVLVLMNFCALAKSTEHSGLKVKWLTRRRLWYAEADEQGKYVARDNSGLKGVAARWARENLEKGGSEWLEEVRYGAEDEGEVFDSEMEDADLVTFAVGYTACELPELWDGERKLRVAFDHDDGTFRDADGTAVGGLHGAGIAFAEKVRDGKYGHEEMNIGFMGFMKAIRRWVKDWEVVE